MIQPYSLTPPGAVDTRRQAIVVVIACAFAYSLSSASVASASTDTYLATWEGDAFLEFADALERFVGFPTDANENGMPTLPAQRIEPTNATDVVIPDISDAWIESQMILRGVTKESAVSQIETALANATYATAKDEAILRIQAGQYLSAAAFLANTPASIYYYCDQYRTAWYIGIPVGISCVGSTVPDVVVEVELTYIQFTYSLHVNSVDFIFEASSASPLLTKETYVGFGYTKDGVDLEQMHILALDTSVQDHFTITVRLRGLMSSVTDAYAKADMLIGALNEYDHLLYTYGKNIGYDTTGAVAFHTSYTSYDIFAKLTKQSQLKWNLYLSIVNAYGIRLAFWVTMPDNDGSGRPILVGSIHNPTSAYTLEYERSSGWNGFTWDIILRHGIAGKDTEIDGRFGKPFSEEFWRFRVVGLPLESHLRITPGTDACDGHGSIDLLKISDESDTRYRAIAANGYSCEKKLSIAASNIQRARIAGGEDDPFYYVYDPWPMLHLGADIKLMADSRLRVVGDPDNIFFPAVDTTIYNELPEVSHGRWAIKRNGACLTDCSGDIEPGDYERQHNLGIVAYYWNIGADQLDIDICKPDYLVWPDGRCL